MPEVYSQMPQAAAEHTEGLQAGLAHSQVSLAHSEVLVQTWPDARRHAPGPEPSPSQAQLEPPQPTPVAVHDGVGEVSCAKLMIGRHAPFRMPLDVCKHDSHTPAHGASQHTPSAQALSKHCVAF